MLATLSNIIYDWFGSSPHQSPTVPTVDPAQYGHNFMAFLDIDHRMVAFEIKDGIYSTHNSALSYPAPLKAILDLLNLGYKFELQLFNHIGAVTDMAIYQTLLQAALQQGWTVQFLESTGLTPFITTYDQYQYVKNTLGSLPSTLSYDLYLDCNKLADQAKLAHALMAEGIKVVPKNICSILQNSNMPGIQLLCTLGCDFNQPCCRYYPVQHILTLAVFQAIIKYQPTLSFRFEGGHFLQHLFRRRLEKIIVYLLKHNYILKDDLLWFDTSCHPPVSMLYYYFTNAIYMSPAANHIIIEFINRCALSPEERKAIEKSIPLHDLGNLARTLLQRFLTGHLTLPEYQYIKPSIQLI